VQFIFQLTYFQETMQFTHHCKETAKYAIQTLLAFCSICLLHLCNWSLRLLRRVSLLCISWSSLSTYTDTITDP